MLRRRLTHKWFQRTQIRACSRAEDDGGDGPTTATADPRHMFFPEQSVVVEFFGGGGDGEVPENQEDPEDGSTIVLYMWAFPSFVPPLRLG